MNGVKTKVALVGLLAACPLLVWAGETPQRVALNGSIVLMPRIEALDCTAMARVIQGIDATGYRDPDGPALTEAHPDWPIFQYENNLTSAEYFNCTLGKSRDTAPGLAFGND